MKLYLIRHAIAVDPDFGLSDAQRQLTKEGRKKFTACCETLRKWELQFDLIASSPYVRARQTAEILASQLGGSNDIIFFESLTPGHTITHLIKELAQYSYESVALVGHEPLLSGYLSQFISGNLTCNLLFKKGGIACIDFENKVEIASGTLKFFIPPSLMLN